MAYDRYENRRERSPDYNRGSDRPDFRSGRSDERGFFERAGDEIASWFGDDDAERRRRQDERMNRDDERNDWTRGRDYDRGYGRDFERDRGGFRASSGNFGRDRDRDRYRSSQPRSDRGYERMGYGAAFGAGNDRGYGSGGFGYEYGDYDRDRDYGRSQRPWGRDDDRNTSSAGSGRDNDRHYHAWRQRQMDELDSDYNRYNRERQERFENDFGSWRQNRMGKRSRLGSIREHMDVVGSDGETVGKVDCVRGDHIVLTKGDSPDNRHHKLDCSMIETVEGDQVRLDIPAEEAKSRWEDAGNRDRGFFGRDRERDDRDEETNLNRSFSGTYENES